MASEFDLQMAARHRQAELLGEASFRRLTRTDPVGLDEPSPSRRRLQTLLRRIAGAPTFA